MNTVANNQPESHVLRGGAQSSVLIRLGWGLLVGVAVSALPWIVSRLDISFLSPVTFLDMPGVFVALIFSGWNVHTYDPSLLFGANVVIYAGLVYLLLSMRTRRRRSGGSHPSSNG
jgi:hypothetical protein